VGRRGRKPDVGKQQELQGLLEQGMSLSEAARVVGVNRRTAKRWRNGRNLRCANGQVLRLEPVINTPAEKTYSPRYLSLDERIRLADLHHEHRTVREIGLLLGRAPSTVSRELRRGSDAAGRYRPFDAHRSAMARRRVQRPSRMACDPVLREWVAGRLVARWSPEQVSHELRVQFPDRPDRWLCPETIYQAVYRPDLGGLPRELPGKVLRRRRRQRVRHRDAGHRRSGPVTGMTPIDQRPESAADRVEPGHWEGDLIVGAGNASAIVTLVERTSRFTILGHLPGPHHDAATVRDSLLEHLGPLPPELRLTLTWDQGTEMARHRETAHALGTTRIYFCDPHSPWQRPSNENTNGLLREYFPKGSDLSVHTPEDLARVQEELNNRPRKVLGWDTPAQVMAKAGAGTGRVPRI
jgi:IS30 family transposase